MAHPGHTVRRRPAPPARQRAVVRLALACWLAIAAAPAAQAQQHVGRDTTRAGRRADTTVAADTGARAPARLQAVTITASPVRRAEPQSSITISPRVLAMTPATSPWDLLRQAAGVEVHLQGQGPGFASDASIRGFSSDHSTDLALWIDGVPVNEPVNGHAEGYNDWSLIFPAAIEDVDVIKGPTSALYGNFALAGVVSVRTLDRMTGTRAWLSGGSYGNVDATVMTGFDHGARGGGVFGVRWQRDDGWRPNSRYDLGQGHFRVVHDLSPSTRIDGGVELYGGRWDSPGYINEAQFEAGDYGIVSNPTDGGHKYHAQERVSLRVLKGSLLWRSTLYATQGNWQFWLTVPPNGGRFEGSGSQTEEVDHRVGLGATSALTWELPAGQITVGAEGRWDRASYQNWFTTDRVRDSSALLDQARQTSGALFAQTSMSVLSRLQLHLGGRVDVLDTRAQPSGEVPATATRGIFSPKLGAYVRLWPGIGVYANTSRGFRSSDGVVEDPALPLITEWAYEGGLKLDRGGVSASLAYFRMDVSNEQTFNPLTSGSNSGGASRRTGVEITGRARLSPRLAFSTDWTFTDARFRHTLEQDPLDPAKIDTLSGLRVYNTAEYVGVAALDVAPAAGPWRVRVSGNVVGPYAPFEEPGVLLPAYGLVHVSGMYRVGSAELELGVRNVLDKAYRDLAAGQVSDQGQLISLVAPGQPRSVYGSVRYAF